MKPALKSALVLIIATGVSGHASALEHELRPLEPGVMLPDKTEFLTWEKEGCFSKTYHVNQQHADASDDNPGTIEKPFKTISAAASRLKPGERVLIHSGIYREWIQPACGGNSPEEMISYEAAPGETPVIKGSLLTGPSWERSGHAGVLWKTTLSGASFEHHGFNPFKIRNLEDEDVIYFGGRNKPNRWPYNLKRGLIFQDGRRLRQVLDEGMVHTDPGQYFVHEDGLTISIRPFGDADPNKHEMEYTFLPHVFRPARPDMAYIRVKGLRFEQIANGLRRIGSGAVFTFGGHHWIIEENVIAHCGGTGLEFGWSIVEHPKGEPSPERGTGCGNEETWNIIRNNEIYDCGSAGIRCRTVKHDLVESNHIHHIGWQGNQFHRENAGIKLLLAQHTLVRKNIVHHIHLAAGIWMDWDIQYSRISQNLVYDLTGDQAAMILEASLKPNWIDHNIFWNVQPRGYYSHATDNAVVAHNLVGHSTREGYTAAIGVKSRGKGQGRNNVFAHNISFSVPEDIHIPAVNKEFNTVYHHLSDDRFPLDLSVEQTGEEGAFVLTWKNQGQLPEAAPYLPALSGRNYFDDIMPSNTVPAGPIDYPSDYTRLLQWNL